MYGREISTMSVFSVDGMRSLDWDRIPLYFDEETPFRMVSKLARVFAERNPRLGSCDDVLKHIVQGIGLHKILKDAKNFFKENAPTAEEYEKGIRTSIKFFVSAFEGCGCIEWKSGFEYSNIDANGII